jgi:hypothetical protein
MPNLRQCAPKPLEGLLLGIGKEQAQTPKQQEEQKQQQQLMEAGAVNE